MKFLVGIIIGGLLTMVTPAQKLSYPVTKKVDQIDTYFGVQVADPYRWLEDDHAPEVEKWVQEQNAVTFGYLDKIPFRKQLKERIEQLVNYPRYSGPFKRGDYYYFFKNDGLQNQAVLYRQKCSGGAEELFFDPNLLSADGTVALRGYSFSRDNKYMAYEISRSGSDWQEIYVLETATKTKLQDQILWNKISGASWVGNGFYYSRYDEPKKTEKAYSEQNTFLKVYYHKLGTPQSADQFVFQDTSALIFSSVSATDDEHFLFLYKSGQGKGNALAFKNLQAGDKEFHPLIEEMEHDFWVTENIGDSFIVQTNLDANKSKIILVDSKNPDRKNWKTIIPECEYPMAFSSVIGNKIFVGYLKDVKTIVRVFDLTGKFEQEIPLPTSGTASGFGGKRDDMETFFSFTSFTYPTTIYHYDIASGKVELFRKSDVKFNPDDYETKQVFYPSKDGTKIPMYIVHKKGIPLNGNNPTLLYAYGGFNISLEPGFSAIRLSWLEQGGIYAQANLRGGGEYGEEWHEAGMKLRKQNVYDDFIAAAEYLITNKYTSTPKLAINGGSNGGLLIGAMLCQRPDLFGAAVADVGVMDMLRFQKFTIGWNWAREYGSSDDSLDFKNLYGYSPLHNLKSGTHYPPTMITTADHDDRVVPAHSFKFAATMQEKQAGDAPVIIRIETKSGHGSSSLSKAIESMADMYSFLFAVLNHAPKF